MFLLSDDSFEIKNTPKKGRGVFAKKDLNAGIVIGDYLGKVIKTAIENVFEDKGLYLMYYHDYASIYPEDVNASGIHLLNHSCAPNCWMYIYKGHTLFFTLRKIFEGEELTLDYLLSPIGNCSPCKHQCLCKTPLCTHTMHLSKERFEKWNKFIQQQTKKTKRQRIKYGALLPKLISYPKIILDQPIYKLIGNLDQPSLKINDSKLPNIKNLRKLIRDTGRTLIFPAIKVKILGVQNDELLQNQL